MSKWFKNKETGVVWEVADENLIKRLASNENAYQEISNPTTKKKGQTDVPADKGSGGDNSNPDSGNKPNQE